MSGQVQLPLRFALPDSARFDNFYAGPNAEVVTQLQSLAVDAPMYLWGAQGCGKSHLLQAACRVAAERDAAAAYVPLAELVAHPPAVLDGFETRALVCVDDLQAIAGRGDWEEALFHLFNRTRDAGAALVVAALGPPAEIGLTLPDLVSRLGWGLVYPLRALDDAGRLQVLQLRARGRGLELPDDSGCYMLRRYPRDLPRLCALLDQLDEASMVAQRRLTVPFVKAVLEGE